MGGWAELFHPEPSSIWPRQVAPLANVSNSETGARNEGLDQGLEQQQTVERIRWRLSGACPEATAPAQQIQTALGSRPLAPLNGPLPPYYRPAEVLSCGPELGGHYFVSWSENIFKTFTFSCRRQ